MARLRRRHTEVAERTVSPSATEPAPTVLPGWFVGLRAAATDLVRETSFKDKDGSKRAFADLVETFAAVKSRLRVTAPDETAAIDMWIGKTDASLNESNVGKAHTYAANIIKELSDAAAKLTLAAPAATSKGLPAVFANLKATARDLDQEAEFQDAAGIKRELAAFTKLFNASRAAIKAKSPKAEALIATALASATDEVRVGDKAGIRREAKALVAAVARAAQLAAAAA